MILDRMHRLLSKQLAAEGADDWSNSAWMVVEPLDAYQRIGHVAKSNASIGSTMLLPSVYQKVKIQKGDVILGLVGGDFWIQKGTSTAVPIQLFVSNKHPMERSSGMAYPFVQRWPTKKMQKLDAIPKYTVQRTDKKFDTPPKGAKRPGSNIDFIVEERSFHHGTVRQWKNGRHMKNGSGWERVKTGRAMPMASKVPAFGQAASGSIPAGVWEDPNDFSRQAVPTADMSAAIVNAVAGRQVVGVGEALDILGAHLDGEAVDESAMKMVFGVLRRVGGKKKPTEVTPAKTPEHTPVNVYKHMKRGKRVRFEGFEK